MEFPGWIRKTYDVVSGKANVHASTAYKSNEMGFGWTKPAYWEMREIVKEPGTAQ